MVTHTYVRGEGPNPKDISMPVNTRACHIGTELAVLCVSIALAASHYLGKIALPYWACSLPVGLLLARCFLFTLIVNAIREGAFLAAMDSAPVESGNVLDGSSFGGMLNS